MNLTSLMPTATATTAPTATGTTAPTATATTEPTAMNLTSLMPTAGEFPNNLVHIETRPRSLEEVAQNYTDPAATIDRFNNWGWIGNVISSFQMPSGVSPTAEEINGIYISVHTFANGESARAALDFSLDEQAVGTPLREVASPSLGDYSRALYGTLPYGDEATLLVQEGNLLLRVSATSFATDPTGIANRLMQSMLART